MLFLRIFTYPGNILKYLRDSYYARNKDCIEKKLIRAQQRIKSAFDEAARKLEGIRLNPDSVVLQRNGKQLAMKQSLLDRKRALSIQTDFNFEGIVRKVDSLDRR